MNDLVPTIMRQPQTEKGVSIRDSNNVHDNHKS